MKKNSRTCIKWFLLAIVIVFNGSIQASDNWWLLYFKSGRATIVRCSDIGQKVGAPAGYVIGASSTIASTFIGYITFRRFASELLSYRTIQYSDPGSTSCTLQIFPAISAEGGSLLPSVMSLGEMAGVFWIAMQSAPQGAVLGQNLAACRT